MVHNRDMIGKTIQKGTVEDGVVYVGGKAVCNAPADSQDGDSVTVTKVNGVVVASK